jgi:hypothetical protein
VTAPLTLTAAGVAQALGWYCRRDGKRVPDAVKVRVLCRSGKLPPPIFEDENVRNWYWSTEVIQRWANRQVAA